jgi:hypothetical protein
VNQSVIIAQADKNLGPVGIDVKDYIKLGLEHLLDTLTYKMLTETQAARDIHELREEIYSWTIRHQRSLSDDVVDFIRKHLDNTADDPLGYFYLLIKLHKTPISGRLVCLNCGSLPHALGQWVDETLESLWRDVVATPKGHTPLHCLTNQQGYDVPIERLTITWHHPPNLGNLLSYRKLENCTGLKVLSFIKT